MKHILLSLNDRGNARLQRLASEEYEGKKGALSQTVEEALEEFEINKKQRTAIKKLIAFARQDHDLGVGRFERKMAYKGKRFD